VAEKVVELPELAAQRGSNYCPCFLPEDHREERRNREMGL